MATTPQPAPDPLLNRFVAVRARTAALAAPLSEADAGAQSMPDASPAKWHLAHTTWFWDTFALAPLGIAPLRPEWGALFNSYYESAGPRVARAERGLLTRPGLAEVLGWRAAIEERVAARWGAVDPAVAELGIAHEEQHQELLLTDLLHLFSRNPLAPAYLPAPPARPRAVAEGWAEHPGGVAMSGAGPDGFAFDCERPRHQVLLRPYALAAGCVTNAQWAEFIADGGYREPLLWLADGWEWVRREGIAAPLYWRGEEQELTLAGLHPRDPATPVAHISQYEADAYATWAGARLPTEAEWEAAFASADPGAGDQLDGAETAPVARGHEPFGGVWEWTRSAFLPHPGFRPAAGALGEYNGKFMSGQAVLKGASCATPRGHSRPSYRNFFPPWARWQFTGVRLARDL